MERPRSPGTDRASGLEKSIRWIDGDPDDPGGNGPLGLTDGSAVFGFTLADGDSAVVVLSSFDPLVEGMWALEIDSLFPAGAHLIADPGSSIPITSSIDDTTQGVRVRRRARRRVRANRV